MIILLIYAIAIGDPVLVCLILLVWFFGGFRQWEVEG